MSASHTPRAKLDPREEHFLIPGPIEGLRLFLRRLGPNGGSHAAGVVLYVHGMSFPSALSIAHRFDGRSWRDELCDSGFDTWALDFCGFGGSDSFVEMSEPAELNPPLGRIESLSSQIEQAVRFICERQNCWNVSIVAHSGGCIATGHFAIRCPGLVNRLVFFAPIVRRVENGSNGKRFPAWRLVSLKDQWDRFVEDVPKGEAPVLSQEHFRDWGERYLETDAESQTRSPASVKTPCGLIQDVMDAWQGTLSYDPSKVRAPLAIVRGEWDTWCDENDARRLFDALTGSSEKRAITISRGTHLMHLEQSRHALHHETSLFLSEPSPKSSTHFDFRQQQILHEGDRTMPVMQEQQQRIPGYTSGGDGVAKSPITMQEWDELKKTALFSEEDVVYLRMSEELLKDHVEDLLAAWRGIVFDLPHLAAYYQNPRTHEVDTEYAKAVRKRFGQWILDTARAKYDQAWLDYQYEIGLRHHRAKKNQTDNGHTAGHIRGRDIFAFVPSILIPMKPYLAKNGHPPEVVERMYEAWWKSMVLQATLWCQPYFRENDF